MYEYVSPVVLPSNSQGEVINVSVAPYTMQAGYTAVLILQLQQASDPPAPITLTLTPSVGTSNCTYTTVGEEFPNQSGYYTAQAKVYNGSGVLLYSIAYTSTIYIQKVLA